MKDSRQERRGQMGRERGEVKAGAVYIISDVEVDGLVKQDWSPFLLLCPSRHCLHTPPSNPYFWTETSDNRMLPTGSFSNN
jgi:hypothetical protein